MPPKKQNLSPRYFLLPLLILANVFNLSCANPKKLLEQAVEVWQKNQDYDQAMKLTDEAIKADAKFVDAYQMKVSLLMEKKDWEPALTISNQLIELAPKDPAAYFNRAKIYYNINTGNQALAKKDLEHSITLYPPVKDQEISWLLFYRGISYVLLNKKDDLTYTEIKDRLKDQQPTPHLLEALTAMEKMSLELAWDMIF